jgi:hypothetical protein
LRRRELVQDEVTVMKARVAEIAAQEALPVPVSTVSVWMLVGRGDTLAE